MIHDGGTTHAGLGRVLGRSHAAWLVAGNMIGAGIFITPGLVLENLAGAWALVAWCVGGLIALAGAAVYGELGSRIPRAGGDYQYVREAFGPLPGFLTGWAAITMSFSAAAAAMARVSVEHLATAIGASTSSAMSLVVAPAMILLLTAANASSVRTAGRTTVLLTALPVAVIVTGAVKGIVSSQAEGATSLGATPLPHVAWFGAALVPIYFTYSGWNAAAYMAGEMRDARRDLGRALLVGTACVMAFYLVFNAALLASVSRESIAGSTGAATVAASRLAGPVGERLLALAVSLAVMGSANVTLMAGARIYYAMGADGLAPSAFARTNRSGVPGTALWISGAWTALLATMGGVGELVAWATLAILFLSSLAVASLFVLRRRDSESPGFDCPGYPLTPLVYIVVSLGVSVSSLLYDPRRAAVGVSVLAAGVPVYMIWRHRTR